MQCRGGRWPRVDFDHLKITQLVLHEIYAKQTTQPQTCSRNPQTFQQSRVYAKRRDAHRTVVSERKTRVRLQTKMFVPADYFYAVRICQTDRGHAPTGKVTLAELLRP